MTTWKEAFNAFRNERTEAKTVKELRDSYIRDLMKTPRGKHTGQFAYKLFKEIYELTSRNYANDGFNNK